MTDDQEGSKGVVLGDPAKVDRLASHVRGLLDELGLDRNDPNLRETDRACRQDVSRDVRGPERREPAQVTDVPKRRGLSLYGHWSGHPVLLHVLAPSCALLWTRSYRLRTARSDRGVFPSLHGSSTSMPSDPQLQERLTEQVVKFFEEELQPEGAMVVIQARHLCVEMRGSEEVWRRDGDLRDSRHLPQTSDSRGVPGSPENLMMCSTRVVCFVLCLVAALPCHVGRRATSTTDSISQTFCWGPSIRSGWWGRWPESPVTRNGSST